MRSYFLLIWFTFVTISYADVESRTWIATFKNSEDCEIQIKLYCSSDALMTNLNEINKAKFSLRSLSSIDDAGSIEVSKHAFRFTIRAQGQYSTGTDFIEGRGGVSTTVLEAIQSAQKTFSDLQKQVTKESGSKAASSLKLNKIVISHEPWESWKDEAPAQGAKTRNDEQAAPSNGDKPSK